MNSAAHTARHTVNNNTTVHAGSVQYGAPCGAGHARNRSQTTRRPSQHAVTCTRCIKILAANAPAEVAPVAAPVVDLAAVAVEVRSFRRTRTGGW